MSKRIAHEETVSLEQGIDLLEKLVQALKRGVLRLSDGENGLMLKPASVVNIGVVCRRSEREESLCIGVRWQPSRLEITASPRDPEVERPDPASCEAPTHEDLYARARRLRIPGRASMTTEQLLDALRARDARPNGSMLD